LLNANTASTYSNIGFGLIGQNRLDEAQAAFDEAHAKNLDSQTMHVGQYLIAMLKNDEAGMQREVDWAKGKPSESTLLDTHAGGATMTGQINRARALGSQAVELAKRQDQKELAGRYLINIAGTEVIVGSCGSLQKSASDAQTLSDARATLGFTALMLALCNDAKQAQMIVTELSRKYPQDSFVNYVYLPTVQAVVAMNRNDFSEALRLLELSRRFEGAPAIAFFPAYVRGLVYLRAAGWGKQNTGASQQPDGAQIENATKAAGEFKNILDHPGIAGGIPIYPVSHVWLARAAALKGDVAGARKSYQDFLAMWKAADADIPILQQAKLEYEKVK
jgi:tetratricopeptide (TPR) repeat protein